MTSNTKDTSMLDKRSCSAGSSHASSAQSRSLSKSPGKTQANAIDVDDEDAGGPKEGKEASCDAIGDDSFEFEDDPAFATISAMMAEQGF